MSDQFTPIRYRPSEVLREQLKHDNFNSFADYSSNWIQSYHACFVAKQYNTRSNQPLSLSTMLLTNSILRTWKAVLKHFHALLPTLTQRRWLLVLD